MLTSEEIEGIRTQNEIAILCGCAECGRMVTNEYMLPAEGAVIIKRQPEEVFSLEFALCGQCARKLVEV